MGVLTKDIQQNLSQTKLIDETHPAIHSLLDSAFADMEQQARRSLDEHQEDISTLRFERFVDIRYKGQNHELTIPVPDGRSEEHTSELQSLMRISYAVFCLKKKNNQNQEKQQNNNHTQDHEILA